MARPQGRQMDALREVTARIERLDRVDASARFAFGTSSALASVSGPIEAKLGVEAPSKATLDILVRPLSGIPGITERLLVSNLRNVFTPAIILGAHPRTLIQVVIQNLSPPPPSSNLKNSLFETNPSTTAVMVNAASIAFLQASSLPLTGVIVAVAVGVSLHDGERVILVDPEDSELETLVAGGVFAFLSAQPNAADPNDFSKAKVVWSFWDGTFRPAEVSQAEVLARAAGFKVLRTFYSVIFEGNSPSMELD